MRRMFVFGGAAALAAFSAAPATHRLEATPATIAYGWYDAAAAPVLTIASGDIIDVDTLLTNSPAGLRRAGVAEDRIQASLKAIVAETPQERRGPGGHSAPRLPRRSAPVPGSAPARSRAPPAAGSPDHHR